MRAKNSKAYEKDRLFIARKVRELREARQLTQADLARRLRLSQARLSQIERGDGSFTAEQFLVILKTFNVPVRDFAPKPTKSNATSELQQALARLGANLQEDTETLPSERLTELLDVAREILVGADSPRLLTELGAVIVHNIQRINLRKLEKGLLDLGLERRLYWLVDNLIEALRSERGRAHAPSLARLYARSATALEAFASFAHAGPKMNPFPPDVVDAGIRSDQTRKEVLEARSEISRSWNILTTIQPDDFTAALRSNRAAR